MSRFRTYGQEDNPEVTAGDTGFTGVNMRLEPHLLPHGYVSEAINMRFNHGVAETRLGSTFQTWCNKIVSGAIQPWGMLYGVGVFTDPLTHQNFLIIAADGNIYFAMPNNAPQQMTLPDGITVVTACTFTQAFNVLLCHQGSEKPTLRATSIYSGWSLVTQTATGDGTMIIPNATRSVFFQNRLFVPFGDDEVAVSDIGDYTRFLPGLQEFRINQGSSDKLVAIYKYNDQTLVAFKEHSIYAVGNVYGDLNSASLDEITNKFGLAAPKSIAHVGNDLWFLSELGVMTLKQTELNKVQGVALPASDPIQPLIDRINWRYASNAVAAYWNNRYYLAVPLDDAEVLGPTFLSFSHYDGSGNVTVTGLTVGNTYRWTKWEFGDVHLTNGTQTLSESGDFIAQGTSVVINGTSFSGYTGSQLRRVFKGVNNAILVYDFLNSAWSGYDQADGVSVFEFFLLNYQGRRRLFFISQDGWVRLYEDSFEDALSIPYVDVVVTAQPTTGDTITVNGGTAVTADRVAALNTAAGVWSCPSNTVATSNLSVDSSSNGGFSASSTAPWSAPNTLNTILLSSSGGLAGIRFYATNGVLPAVVTSGSSWFTTSQFSTQPISCSLTTRAYTSPTHSIEDFHWLAADLQTWDPTFSIDAMTEGANEVKNIVTDQTKDGRKFYRPFSKADYVTGNAAGVYDDAYRQDYSLRLGALEGAAAVWGNEAEATGWGSDQTGWGVVDNR